MSAPHGSLLRRLFAGSGMQQIFDIGACSGTEGIRYASMFPQAELHAFEPVVANHSLVLENFSQHPELRAQAHCVALSDQAGTAVLNLSSAQGEMGRHGNKSSSLLEPGRATEVFPWLEFNERITVPTRTLDDFCAEHAIAAIDLIHMDVQGAELMVLRGASSMLPHIRTVWMEVERIPLYLDQPVKQEVEAFMTGNGFDLVISTVGRTAGDQFWVNRAFAGQQPFSVRSSMFLRSWEWRIRMAWQNLRWRLGQAFRGTRPGRKLSGSS
ncbi:MAG: FkbM family methyltransferase [Flavobacteriales bacterium]|nr:FkbM family methyltransferase [Flavobacteriales bacterium]MBK6892727.1 FkbM family methyltransferase [Flavobacteriales bacterium]MBK7246866.1 FkbM family methyltransferase [Flavobacteriales bacterium]MBK7287235.1 FkbM family methyltransferase [Flavobacteriales bacterium]MBK9599252.1 FkbM family methyltransferase [Flavobacteriales bacterium]